MELQKALDGTEDRLRFLPSSDLYTVLTKPLHTLCLTEFSFLFPWLLVLKPGFDKVNASPGDTEREN